jgi:hypothetical protein
MQLTQCSNRTVRAAAIRFDAWTRRRRTALRVLGDLASFALMFGGVAHATYHSALAQSAQASCGETCLAMPGFHVLAAAAWGGVAVLGTLAYAAVLRALGRQPPAATEGDYFLIATGTVLINCDALLGAHAAHVYVQLEFFLAWAFAGIGMVDFFWSRFAVRRNENGGAG